MDSDAPTCRLLLAKLAGIKEILTRNDSLPEDVLREANSSLRHAESVLKSSRRSAILEDPAPEQKDEADPFPDDEDLNLLADISNEDLFGGMDDLDGSMISQTAEAADKVGEEEVVEEEEEESEDETPQIDEAHDDVLPPSPEHIECLKKYFGHSSFRPLQWKIIRSVLVERRDNLIIMATGYGKSLCYQYPAVFSKSRGVTIVVSPLISLMEDQVTALNLSGVSATFLGSGQSNSSSLRNVEMGEYQLVYVTPEYLTSSSAFLTNLHRRIGINLVAIDEAHCVSQWGHDFRSSYRELSCIRRSLGDVPILALTATATPSVRRDVCSSLSLHKPQVLCTSFDRPNLYFEAKPRGSDCAADLKVFMVPVKDTGAMIQYKFPGSTIVYCPTKKLTEEVCSVLHGLGVKVGMYHAGLPIRHRRETHQKFLVDELQCVVATVAFGMGIDKPDVRLVVHYGVPKDIESYYQEMGRAGRDGQQSKCYILYSFKDTAMWKSLLGDISNDNFLRHKLEMISKLEIYVSTSECRRRTLLSHFQDTTVYGTKPRKNCCDNCTTKLKDNARRGANSVDGPVKTDYAKEAKQLLSAITMWQRGMAMSILFLRGSNSSKLPEWSKRKENYGAGTNRTEIWWKALGQMLKNEGYLMDEAFSNKSRGGGGGGGQRGPTYGCTVKLTDKGSAYLRQVKPGPLHLIPTQEMVSFEKQAERIAQPTVVSRAAAPSASSRHFLAQAGLLHVTPVALENASSAALVVEEDLPPTEEEQLEEDLKFELYQQLILVRSGIQSVWARDGMMTSAATIASNATLAKMASQRPNSVEALANVDGMSVEKARKYGKQFVDTIVAFCQKKDVAANVASDSATQRRSTQQQTLIKPSCMKKDMSQTVICSYNMFHEENLSLASIAQKRSLQMTTIGSHLVDAFQAGYPVDYIRAGFTPGIQAAAMSALQSARETAAEGEGLLKAAKRIAPSLDYWHLKMAQSLAQEMPAEQTGGHAAASATTSTSAQASSAISPGTYSSSSSLVSNYFSRTDTDSSAAAAPPSASSTPKQTSVVPVLSHDRLSYASASNTSATASSDAPPLKRQHSDGDSSKRVLPNWLGSAGRQSSNASATGTAQAKKKKHIKL